MTLKRIRKFKDLKIGDYIICVTTSKGIKNLSEFDRNAPMYLEIVTKLIPLHTRYKSYLISPNGTLSSGEQTWMFDMHMFYRISKEDFLALII